ncbi:MAG: hypothetical protein GXY03_03420 [Solirubrobacterales bacterium]|nr:hypothetical protein [Solirubrobacterales bacterium]
MQPSGGDHPATVRSPGRDDGLHVCTGCGSRLVQPLWWEEAANRAWRVGLRCPECERQREGVYSQTLVDAYDARLAEGAEALATAYRRLSRDNLAAELDRFAAALRVDAILPEDF